MTKILTIVVTAGVLGISACGGDAGSEGVLPAAPSGGTAAPGNPSSADPYQQLLDEQARQQQDFEDLQDLQQQRHDSAMQQFDSYAP